MELVKKITMRDIGAEKQLEKVAKEGVTLDLANIAGVARGVKTGVSGFGEWNALTGDFLAINTETGIEFRSATLILPSIAQDIVINALKNADNGVDLAFTIYASPDKDPSGKIRGKGYKFGARPLMQPKEADELARLKNLFPTQKPSVETPKEETPAPAAATPAPVEAPKEVSKTGAVYEASPKTESTTAKPATAAPAKTEPAKSPSVPAKK